MKNNEKSLHKWVSFFKGKKTMTSFIHLLRHQDRTFLTQENTFDFEHPYFELIPKWGFLEQDLKKILESLEKEGISCMDEKTRLVLALSHGVSFKTWKEIYKEDLLHVFIKCLIEGEYEKYGIEYQKIIPDILEKELLEKDDFLAVSVMRGIMLGNRYPDESSQKRLKKEVKINSIKSLLGI